MEINITDNEKAKLSELVPYLRVVSILGCAAVIMNIVKVVVDAVLLII